MAFRVRGTPRIVATQVRRYQGLARREIVVEATNILIQTTPRKTGHAANNWIPKMGQPSREISGSRRAPSNTAQQRGLREIAAEPLESTRVANLTNNVNYVALALVKGTSQQAPTGFHLAAIHQAIVNVRLRLGRLRRAR